MVRHATYFFLTNRKQNPQWEDSNKLNMNSRWQTNLYILIQTQIIAQIFMVLFICSTCRRLLTLGNFWSEDLRSSAYKNDSKGPLLYFCHSSKLIYFMSNFHVADFRKSSHSRRSPSYTCFRHTIGTNLKSMIISRKLCLPCLKV